MLATYGLSHLAIAVSDLDRSLRFYERLLGARARFRDEDKIELETPGSHDVFVLDRSTGWKAGETGSIAHFGFRLVRQEPAEAVAEAVERAGGTVLERGEFVPGEPYVFAKDPDGYTIELWFEPDPAPDAPADERPPWTVAHEKATLVDFLSYLREAMVRKLEALDEELARRPMVASGTSLLGLLKHLTYVERGWFGFSFAGSDDPVPSGDLESGDTVQSVVAAYREACAASNAVVEACRDLEVRCARHVRGPEPLSLRWILVHMIEETARHAGHADILREQLDGTVGR